MTLTRQEAADAIVATELDLQSLEAIFQALRSVSGQTGWGTVTIDMKEKQVTGWKIEMTGKILREKGRAS